ncbi:N-6 DNA methylase, partial [Lentibacillus populi]|uniref:N-6 DNA methylase n=1 Tax=Lentibacillus populi TaxID=1827502 RepID=UPI00166ABBE3
FIIKDFLLSRQLKIEHYQHFLLLVIINATLVTTDISVTFWILNKNKKARTVEQNGKLKKYRNRGNEILFMDLRQVGIPFEKKYVQFSDDDIKKVTTIYHNWQQTNYEITYQNIGELCYSATLKEVEKRDFSLVPSKYIEFINRDENIDFEKKMVSLQSEFTSLLKDEEVLKKDLLGVFKELGYEIKL